MPARKLILFTLLIGLAGWSWWLNERDSSPTPAKEAAVDPSLDYYIREFSVVTMDAKGQRTRSLQSDSLDHTLEDGVTKLSTPYLQIFEASATPAWRLQADRGRLSEDGTELLLSGRVEIENLQDSDGIPMHILTSNMTLLPEQHYAETSAPVTITNGDNQITSTGLQAWFKEPAHIKFNAKTRGYYAAHQN